MAWLNGAARFLGDFAGAFAMTAFIAWRMHKKAQLLLENQEQMLKKVESIDHAVNNRTPGEGTISEEISNIGAEQIRVGEELKDKESE